MTDQGVPIGATAIKPIERHGWEAFSWFMYDRNTGAIMGRTPMSWFLITVFYIVYYSCLAGFWLFCMFILYLSIEEHQPRWQQDAGLIGRSPALGVRPGQGDSFIESSIIIFNQDNPKDGEIIPGYKQWVNRLDDYLQPYKTAKANGLHCIRKQEDRMRFYAEGKFCQFDITKLGPCVEGNHGFDSASPCLILKLNKIFGLEHEYHEDTALPEEMPAELKARIGAATDKNQVWVSCKAEFPADKEGVESLELFPKDGGFPSYYFPYLKQEGYQSPLVAVRINNITPGQLIHVECRAWAKNIKYNRRDRVGIVRFEVMNQMTRLLRRSTK